LIAAQKTSPATPYVYFYINSTNYTSRVKQLEHIEEPYRDRATIVLDNHDRLFDGVNLRGKSFILGHGYNTTSGNKYCGDSAGSEAVPTLWVKKQNITSLMGESVCILECEGGWIKLRELIFIAEAEGLEEPYLNVTFTATDTVFALIQKALVEAGFTLNAIGTQDDSIINSYYPIFTVNKDRYESPASIISRLIQMTKTFLRIDSPSVSDIGALPFEVIYPQSSDSVQETYYSDQAPYFKEYREELNLTVPNHVIVFANKNLDPDMGWTNLITAHAYEDDQFTDGSYTGSYEEIIHYHLAPYISTQEDADARAAAVATRIKADALSGVLTLPFHDCRVELYDRVRIKDGRGF